MTGARNGLKRLATSYGHQLALNTFTITWCPAYMASAALLVVPWSRMGGTQMEELQGGRDDVGLGARHQRPRWMRFEVLLASFLTVYVGFAIATQVESPVSPSVEGAPIEAFSSGLLWIASMYGLVRASESIETGKRLLFWLAMTAAAGALAVDEIVGIHERTEPGFNDDWIKVVMWIATPFLLRYIAKLENAPRNSRVAMMIGFAFQTAYILVETGDGEIFTLPIAVEVLKWSEEIFELFFLALYVYAFWVLILRQHVQRGALVRSPTDASGE